MNENKENKITSKKVETYTEDMVKALERDKQGLVKKIIHEEEEREIEKINLSPSSKKNKVFMLVSIIFILCAFGILVFLAFFQENINTTPAVPEAVSLIFTDRTEFKPIDGLNKEKIIDTVWNQINDTKVKVDGVEGIYLTENKKVIGFKRFATVLKTSLVDPIGYISDNFLTGVVNQEKTKDFFILLKIRSFTDVFPLMRAWETKMLYDFHGFFGLSLNPQNNYLFTKDWEDGIVQNKNARMLKDNDGKIVLMYVFVSDTSLVISDSEVATAEVMLRLASSQIKK